MLCSIRLLQSEYKIKSLRRQGFIHDDVCLAVADGKECEVIMKKYDYVFIAGVSLTLCTSLFGGLLSKLSIMLNGYTLQWHWVVILFSHLSVLVAGIGLMCYGVIMKVRDKH